MEENKNELEENNKVTSFIIVICVLTVVAFLIFMIISFTPVKDNDNKNKDAHNSEKDSSENMEKLSVDSSIVQKLFNTFREDQSCTYTDIMPSINDSIENKKIIAYIELNKNNTSTRKCGTLETSWHEDGYYCGRMNDEAAKYYGSENNLDKFTGALSDEETTIILKEDLKKKYEELFGKDTPYEDGTFIIGYATIAYYDATNNLYASFQSNSGGDCILGEQPLLSIEQNADQLTLVTKYEDYNGEVKNINYNFKYDNGNYIFINREEK